MCHAEHTIRVFSSHNIRVYLIVAVVYLLCQTQLLKVLYKSFNLQLAFLCCFTWDMFVQGSTSSNRSEQLCSSDL